MNSKTISRISLDTLKHEIAALGDPGIEFKAQVLHHWRIDLDNRQKGYDCDTKAGRHLGEMSEDAFDGIRKAFALWRILTMRNQRNIDAVSEYVDALAGLKEIKLDQ